MREIKFRYKVKGLDKLIYDRDEEFGYLQQQREFFSYEGDIKQVQDEMQYTGLKDKNGVDIYEGDVTKACDLICLIEFRGCKFVAKWKGKRGDYRYPDLMFKSHEVIGNIHQNPELLDD